MKLWYMQVTQGELGFLFTEEVKDKLPATLLPLFQYLSEDDILLFCPRMKWIFIREEEVKDIQLVVNDAIQRKMVNETTTNPNL